MKLQPIVAILFALLLIGCAAGPGGDCDPCSSTEAVATTPGEGSQAAAASATGGQRASNQPVMSDPASWNPNVNWSRGEGDATANNNWWTERAQAGAPSVNQGLIIPNNAEAENAGGCVSPAVQTLQALVYDLQQQLRLALLQGNSAQAAEIFTALDSYTDKLARAEAASGGVVNNTYHMEGQMVYQTVANSSTGSGPSGKSKATEGDATSGEDPATDVAPPVPEAMRPLVEGAAGAPETLEVPPVEDEGGTP